MPKNRGRTAAGKIEHYLRGAGKGKPFSVEEFSSMFGTTESNVNTILRGLRVNGWTINQHGYAMRNVKKPHYIALPPGEKA